MTEQAVAHGMTMLEHGADWLDVGGESTRPCSRPVSAEEEARRVVPVIEALHERRPDAILSIDTSKSSVAGQALRAGAAVVNDVSGLRDPNMAATVVEYDAELVIMHMRGTPDTMQQDTHYDKLLAEIDAALLCGIERAMAAGMPKERIILDPGIGFGKALEDNAVLIQHLQRWQLGGHRVMIGASRKSFIGQLTNEPDPQQRLAGSLGAALAAAENGADILRVHDVKETRDALTVFHACRRTV